MEPKAEKWKKEKLKGKKYRVSVNSPNKRVNIFLTCHQYPLNAEENTARTIINAMYTAAAR